MEERLAIEILGENALGACRLADYSDVGIRTWGSYQTAYLCPMSPFSLETLSGPLASRCRFSQDAETEATLSKFAQRVQQIGHEVTAFSMSNLQTHSLIDSTVQLW